MAAKGWSWQKCTEMVMPIGISSNGMMLQDDEPYNIDEFSNFCQKEFGVTPRPHWISMDFDGHKIKSVLKFLQKFSSNVIFTNGLRDPYNSGGVLENISDSVVAIRTQLWFSLLRY